MDEDYKLGYPASDVLHKLHWVENKEKILLDTRWGIVDVLWSDKASWDDGSHFRRHLHAVEQAMESAECALRLVIEVLGEDSQVDWFWNSCQGHFSQVTAFAREDKSAGLPLPGFARPEANASATGGTLAIAILTALVRVKGRLNQIEVETAKSAPPENSEATAS